MGEYINPAKLTLSEDFFKLAVLEEIQNYFLNDYVINEWKMYVSETVNEEIIPTEKKCLSFDILCEIVRSLLLNGKITREVIKNTFEKHSQYIIERISEHINHDFYIDKENSINDNTVHLAKDGGHLVSSMDYKFHLVRNIVTKPKSFTPNESKEYQAQITDSNGNVHGFARLNMNNEFEMTMNAEEQDYWKRLRSAFNSMDEMTADIFDIICFLYLFAPKDAEGYLYFHSNDALKLRSNVINSSNNLQVRESDRFNIMSRIKALSNIWVSLTEGEVIEVDENDLKESTKYKYRDWQKMFEIGKVRAAYDENDHFLGIYACQIRPTSLLTSFLNENKRLGIIDLTTLEFHPIRQRPEKRLVRYLSIQWFIRLSNRNLLQSFTVKKLIQEIDFGVRMRGTDIYERFIKALNELKSKGIIKEWHFTEEVDFSHYGKKGWLPYFLSLKMKIIPSREMIEKNKRKLSILENHYHVHSYSLAQMFQSVEKGEIIETIPEPSTAGLRESEEISQSQDVSAVDISEETLTPEMVIEERKRRNLSVLKASKEMGIGYNTLKRFENRLTTRRNKNNDRKIVKWLQESVKIN